MSDQLNLEMKIIANALITNDCGMQDGTHFNYFSENGWSHIIS